MTSTIPSEAIGADAPTSRGTFRLIAKSAGATNRDADTLRHALLAEWADDDGILELVHLLKSLDEIDPQGDLGAEARLAFWFTQVDPGDGHLVAADHPVLTDLSDEFCARLTSMTRTPTD